MQPRLISIHSSVFFGSLTRARPNETVRFKESDSRKNHSTDSLKRSNSKTIRSLTGHSRFLSLYFPESMAVDLHTQKIPRLISVYVFVSWPLAFFLTIIIKIPLLPHQCKLYKISSTYNLLNPLHSQVQEFLLKTKTQRKQYDYVLVNRSACSERTQKARAETDAPAHKNVCAFV